MALPRLSFPCITILTFVSLAGAVDRGNFKTCDQSGFCKRHRNLQPGPSHYEAQLDTLDIKEAGISMNLLNTEDDVKFKLEVTGLLGGMVRMRVTELDPIRPRYEPPVGDTLVKEPELTEITVQKKSDQVLVGYQEYQLVIQAKPFRLDIIEGNTLILSVNSKGLMKFEHSRDKEGVAKRVGSALFSWFSRPFRQAEEQKPAEQEGEEHKEGDGNTNESKPTEEPDLWEETFKGHADTKPNGPTSIGMDFAFPGFEHVYGIPEHADTFALKSTKGGDPYRLYNLDVFEYELYNPMALYGSIPLMLAHNTERTIGLFWLNAAETWVDISNSKADKTLFSKVVDFVKGDSDLPEVDTHWFSESGIIDVFFLLGPHPDQVFSQYGQLTGTTPLPPLFSIAYHQSRWNYNDEDDVKRVDAAFDEHDIPMDTIWLDIEHTDGKRYFTWDKSKFPHPDEMIRNISKKGRKVVTIIDPHIKRDDNWELHKEAQSKTLYVKNKDGNEYDGWCWPGSSSYLDFVDPEVRKWWSDRFDPSKYEGSNYHLFTWNDMNEPSVFNGPEVTMYKDNQHYGGWEHRDVHNIYGMYVQMASAQGLMKRGGYNERPFVLSRAVFAGSQRWGAIWTGDNTAEWSHLKISVPMILSLSIAGITFSGADVGGFFKNPDQELLTRWYQAAAYQPFFRAHAHLDTRRREPWLLPKENMVIIRNAIRARYALLPYWYTLFYQGEKTGSPVMKPMWAVFPKDAATFAIDDQYMLGNGLLVHPVTEAGATNVNVYFPEGVWYDIDNYRKYEGVRTEGIPVTLAKIPVYLRGGSIIPRKERIRRSANLGRYDPYTLVVGLDREGTASGDLYIDDYHTFRYKKRSEFIHRAFLFRDNKLENKNVDMNSHYTTKSFLERVVIVGLKKKPSKIEVITSGPSRALDFSYSPTNRVLVIRMPNVNIADDWTIELH